MTDYKLSKTADLMLSLLSLMRNDLFLDNNLIKNFPLCEQEFKKNMSSLPLPPSHIKVILYLEKEKSSPISYIAKKLNISKSNMTPIIDKLIELDLVNRYSDNKDRRILRVELTPKAKKLFEAFKSSAKKSLKNKLSTLSDEDLTSLSESLSTLILILQKLN
ncbi:MarR family winged helix-turn-helix transcriptional regulator [uncultured Clostridium sp.]|uniref:MarR family winged helix-turn-helix transcriptional regulator n=1 Tax=uncultured Clostridium sp. TaxID=59620 RepID=UPI0025EC79BF|nr:MarR family transcriptional regulator [uncultured Clostridium sp.]